MAHRTDAAEETRTYTLLNPGPINVSERVRRGLHQRRVEGTPDGERTGGPGAGRLRRRDADVQSVGRAGEDDLTRRVVVGGLADLAVRRSLGKLLRLCKVGAEQRGHRPLADRHRLLHRAAARFQEPRRVGKAQRARCG